LLRAWRLRSVSHRPYATPRTSAYIPIVVRDACGAGDQRAGHRGLESLAFAGDAFIADTDEVCSILVG
jgi:hypothetical protein